jgi:hypothetical protein
MDEEQFGPTGMSRTSMVWQARFDADFANGYDEYGRSLGPEKRRTPDAAGAMQTTVNDYAAFLSEIMRVSSPLSTQFWDRPCSHSIGACPSIVQ